MRPTPDDDARGVLYRHAAQLAEATGNGEVMGGRFRLLLFGAVITIGLGACSGDATGPAGSVAAFQWTNPCGWIYAPCFIDGIYVITRRRQEDPEPTWPEGVECAGIPGGCFPSQGIQFGKEPFMAARGTVNAPGTKYAGYGARLPNGTEERDIKRVLTDLKYSEPQCRPIWTMMESRLGSDGIWMANRDNGTWGGEWVRNEGAKGIVYVSSSPGMNWWSDGSPDMDQLRKTVIEEGIHAWFDIDVSHGPDQTAETLAAMEQARGFCGKYD